MDYWPALLSLAVGLVVAGLCWVFGASAPLLVAIGGGFQLLGLGVVVFTLAHARHWAGADSWWVMFKRFARQFIPRAWRKSKNVTVNAHAATLSSLTAKGSGRVGLPPNATLEQRVDRLEAVMERVEQQQTVLREHLTETAKELRAEGHEEQRARKAEDAKLESKIKELAIGDDAWHLAGAVLFFAGIIFQTLPAFSDLL